MPASQRKTQKPAPPPGKNYGRVSEGAAKYRVSVWTIRRRIADGTIHGYRFGPRLLLIDLDELERHVSGIPTGGQW